MNNAPLILTDHQGRVIRLTAERQAHILEHPELVGQLERLKETSRPQRLLSQRRLMIRYMCIIGIMPAHP